jgi:ABC-2 type transport system ATP-binding protein
MIEIRVKGDPAPAIDALSERGDIERVTCDGRTIRAEYTGDADDIDELLESLIRGGIRVLSFTRSEADLEDIFLRVTRGVVA